MKNWQILAASSTNQDTKGEKIETTEKILQEKKSACSTASPSEHMGSRISALKVQGRHGKDMDISFSRIF